MKKILVVIPARYGSTRFPGKPLAEIKGKTMVERVYEIAKKAVENFEADVLVSTENNKIYDFCSSHGMSCAMTDTSCKTGTDRVCETVKKLDYRPEFILNLQGDAPLTPPWFLTKMIEEFYDTDGNNVIDMVTPGYPMTWVELDKMVEDKKTTPFTGTTIIMNRQTRDALWFSKKIIPAIRGEQKLREADGMSPIIRHIGLYGYSYDMLMKISHLDESYYEKLEGLEQLRVLENGYRIRVALVDYRGRPSSSGVDTPEDVSRAEKIIEEFGELV